MKNRDGAQQRDEQTEEKRRKIVDRLNSVEGGLNTEALRYREESEREREAERQLALEKAKRHSGF